jgi:MFS family permease
LPLEPATLPAAGASAAALPPRDRRFAIMLLLAGVVCVGMGQTIIFTVLPPLARTLGFTEFQVALIFGASALLWAVFSPIWGRRSDLVGRKPMILLGLSGFAISIALFAAMLDLGLGGVVSGLALYALIIGARSIYGFIGSANPASAQAYIADRAPPERRAAALSQFSAAFGIGAMFGPALGGFAAHWGPLAPLYLVSGLAAAMIALIWRFLPEQNRPLQRKAQPRLKAIDMRLRPFLICALGYGLINAVPIQTIAFYFMDVLRLSAADTPKVAGLGLTVGAAASLFAQIVLVQRMRLSPRALLTAGPILICIGHCLVIAGHSAALISLGLAFSGLGAGMALPGYSAGASLAVGPDEQGAAAGVANSVGTLGFVVSPFLGFALYAVAPQAAFMLTATTAAALALFAFSSPAIRALGAKRG